MLTLMLYKELKLYSVSNRAKEEIYDWKLK